MLIQKIKLALGCKTSRELAKLLGVDESQISKFKKTGFGGKGPTKIISLLLEKIEQND